MPMIHVRQLTKTYANRAGTPGIALAGISLDVPAGEIYGLLGPNGAGKTTFLRILGSLLRPTSGSVLVNGMDVVQQPAMVRRQLGFVSSHTAVYDRMTASELVAYYGRLHDVAEDVLQSRMASLFDQLEMNDIRDMLCCKMSTGMRQKVSIARALVHDPPILVFDEATVGLDVLVARALQDLMLELRRQGKCILFSSHIMSEAERLCDRVAILHRGHLLAEATIDQLRQQYHVADLESVFFSLLADRSASKDHAVPWAWRGSASAPTSGSLT